MILRPGEATLADWRAVFRGQGVTVDPACRSRVAASAAVVQAILAKGEPVYGINTASANSRQ